MAMPENWVQSIFLFESRPFKGPMGWTQFFRADGDLSYPFDMFALGAGLIKWWNDRTYSFQRRSTGGQYPFCNFYAFHGSSFRSWVGQGSIPYIVENVLPQSQCAVIQRVGNSYDRDSRGRGYLSDIALSMFEGGHLKQSIVDDITASFNADLGGFTAGGVSFFPSVPSYKNVALQDISQWRCNSRLGVIHRRAKRDHDPRGWDVPRHYPGD